MSLLPMILASFRVRIVLRPINGRRATDGTRQPTCRFVLSAHSHHLHLLWACMFPYSGPGALRRTERNLRTMLAVATTPSAAARSTEPRHQVSRVPMWHRSLAAKSSGLMWTPRSCLHTRSYGPRWRPRARPKSMQRSCWVERFAPRMCARFLRRPLSSSLQGHHVCKPVFRHRPRAHLPSGRWFVQQ